ncbi:chromatin assembly factor 1 subunit A-like [Brevipalpus obovatus]|uniref:chromatin assembly factor 1 subunit A-like n=1 Tax=Brevipalpus obovatus TaxID=246614 RepID=UPI003D9F5B7D
MDLQQKARAIVCDYIMSEDPLVGQYVVGRWKPVFFENLPKLMDLIVPALNSSSSAKNGVASEKKEKAKRQPKKPKKVDKPEETKEPLVNPEKIQEDKDQENKDQEMIEELKKPEEESVKLNVSVKEEKEKEKEEKAAKQSQWFVSHFKRSSLNSSQTSIADKSSLSLVETSFSLAKPFELQRHQILAQIVPEVSQARFKREEFEEIISKQDPESSLYIDQLKSKTHKPYSVIRRIRRQNLLEQDSMVSDVVIYEPTPVKFHKAIFLSFEENLRPAYYGTWSKRPKVVSGRRPFSKESDVLNYEVDSDEEWEEGDDGESIASTGSNGSQKEADDFEIDEFLVPHGHLSGDEDPLDEDESPNHVTLFKEEDLLNQRAKKVERLHQIVLGPCWIGDGKNDSRDILTAFESYAYVFNA